MNGGNSLGSECFLNDSTAVSGEPPWGSLLERLLSKLGCAEAGGFRLLCFADGLAKLCAGALEVVFVLEKGIVDGESGGVMV